MRCRGGMIKLTLIQRPGLNYIFASQIHLGGWAINFDCKKAVTSRTHLTVAVFRAAGGGGMNGRDNAKKAGRDR